MLIQPKLQKIFLIQILLLFPNVDINISIWHIYAEKCMFCTKQYLLSLSENKTIELMANICST